MEDEKDPPPDAAPAPPASQPPSAPPNAGVRNWGSPFVWVDKVLTKIEERLCAAVLIAEILALVFWISIHGLATPYLPGGASLGGLFYRSMLSAVVLGLVAHLVLRPKKGAAPDAKRQRLHAIVVTSSVVVGLVVGRLWANVGVAYFQNVQDWVQNASVLMLYGGLAGLVTRLTLWLALIGASLATAKGKHINFDLVQRLIPAPARPPIAILGWVVAAGVCWAAAVGFFDKIVITEFRVTAELQCPDNPGKSCGEKPMGTKLSETTKKMGTDLFLLGRQISLDFKSLPKILTGQSYKDYLTPAEWNAWMKGADWAAHFPKEEVDKQIVEGETPQLPAIVYPGGPEKTFELLIREADLVFPFGLFMIGLRFLLRVLLVLSGHVNVDPDAAHADDDAEPAGKGDPHRGEAS